MVATTDTMSPTTPPTGKATTNATTKKAAKKAAKKSTTRASDATPVSPTARPTPKATTNATTRKAASDVKDEPKVKVTTAKRSGKSGGVRLDPNLPLIPGNTPTFVAAEGEGRVMAKIITERETWWVKASNGQGDARVSKIIEVPGEITVEFYDDGKKYASGTWTVA